jgi:hypothetical protein
MKKEKHEPRDKLGEKRETGRAKTHVTHVVLFKGVVLKVPKKGKKICAQSSTLSVGSP